MGSYFAVCKVRKARKRHLCDNCGAIIEKGNHYNHISGKYDFVMMQSHECSDCRELEKDNVSFCACEHGNPASECEICHGEGD